MTKLLITLLSSLLLASTALAKPASQVTETNSLSRAMLEMVTQDNQLQGDVEQARVGTHESQKANSLAHAVLAIQAVNTNLRVNSESKVDFSHYSTESEKNNSLSRGALAKQWSYFN